MKSYPHTSRWTVAALLAIATGLSYLDRQSFPVAAGEISKTIAISDPQYARLQFLFLLTYGIMYAGGGRLLDVLGTRRGYAVCMLWWSAATALHGSVSSVTGLGWARLLLGFGEGGGFPASAKAVSECFSAKERSFAFGIFNAGSSLGAIVAPPLVAAIILTSGWRALFLAAGLAGLFWLAFWWKLYSVPAHPLGRTPVVPPSRGWRHLFRSRNTWALLLAKFLSDAAWYFFLFWLPRYLSESRHLDIKAIGYFAWIPYAFAATGSLGGGWCSAFLIGKGLSLGSSRRIVLGISASLLPASLFIADAPLGLAIVFFSMAMCGHQCFSTMMQTLTADLYHPAEVGSAAGIVGAAGSFGGMLFNLLAGAILAATHSYAIVFLLAGIMHPCAFAVLMLLLRRIGPAHRPSNPAVEAFA
ncbi:MAG: major facilitator superfamily 1 [Bryobacterales bacterium]|nr:major facilitator superfamily 1 [Bryobacterales bacterium]